MDTPHAPDILGPPTTLYNWYCTGCQKLYRTNKPELVCDDCKELCNLMAAAIEVNKVSDGNLPGSASRTKGYAKAVDHIGVRPALAHEKGTR